MAQRRAGWSGTRVRRSHRWDRDVHAQVAGAAEFAQTYGMGQEDLRSQTDVVNHALDRWLAKFERKHNHGKHFAPPESSRKGRPRGTTHRAYVTAQYMWDTLILERLDGAVHYIQTTDVEPSLRTKDHVVNEATRQYTAHLARTYHHNEPFALLTEPQRGRPPKSTRQQRGTSPG